MFGLKEAETNRYSAENEGLAVLGKHLSLRPLLCAEVSHIAQSAENLPARQETRVRFLGQEDSLEKEMATHSRILAWEIPWTEEPGRLQSTVSQELDTTW